MKKALSLVCVLLALVVMLAACGGGSSTPPSTAPSQAGSTSAPSTPAAPVDVDVVRIVYVPSMDADLILTSTEPLKQLLIDELAKHNFNVKSVEISVGTSFEAAGEAVAAGSADFGFGGGSVYITYEDEVDLLLTATRDGFNRDSSDPKEWNKDKTEVIPGKEVIGYSGLIYAGPSAKGRELAEKVENGEELTWDDLNSAVWAVANTTSNAGYLYPSLWLKNNYDKTIADLANVLPGTNYPTMVAQAAAEQIDIFCIYADGRVGYEEQWNAEMGRDGSIWDDVKVIGVTDWIMNDVVIGSRVSDAMMLPGFKEALSQSMIDLAKTPEGKEAISVLSHVGYQIGDPANYDVMREVQQMARDLG